MWVGDKLATSDLQFCPNLYSCGTRVVISRSNLEVELELNKSKQSNQSKDIGLRITQLQKAQIQKGRAYLHRLVKRSFSPILNGEQ